MRKNFHSLAVAAALIAMASSSTAVVQSAVPNVRPSPRKPRTSPFYGRLTDEQRRHNESIDAARAAKKARKGGVR